MCVHACVCVCVFCWYFVCACYPTGDRVWDLFVSAGEVPGRGKTCLAASGGHRICAPAVCAATSLTVSSGWMRPIDLLSCFISPSLFLLIHTAFFSSFCQSYDMKQHSTKVFRDIVNALGSFIQSLFIAPHAGSPAPVGTSAGQCP